MIRNAATCARILLAVIAFGFTTPVPADEAVDKAFDALKTYDWGSDRAALQPIETAVVGSNADAAARKALEARLAAALSGEAPQAAKDFVCRQLSLIGTAACVPAVAPILLDEKLTHMARFALERIPDEAATVALREALPKTKGLAKVGVINSLGVRRDAASGVALTALLESEDPQIVAAAAAALGSIGNADAAKTLEAFQAKATDANKLAAADAYLCCAERLLADGKKMDAMKIYKSLSKPNQPKHVQLAARRGLLAALGQK
ncbi:MAG: HEAT repeat domain-containing protein [Pirellulaceae bacterium]